MIPAFDEHGYLPPGIHGATMEEVAERFGRQSELRRVQMESLHWLVDLARRAGVLRIVIDGSFVTDVPEPNDVDCALLVNPGFPLDAATEAELRVGLPFIGMLIVDQEDFSQLVDDVFATDRREVPKGTIEVISWNFEANRN